MTKTNVLLTAIFFAVWSGTAGEKEPIFRMIFGVCSTAMLLLSMFCDETKTK